MIITYLESSERFTGFDKLLVVVVVDEEEKQKEEQDEVL